MRRTPESLWMRKKDHPEGHNLSRTGWLRAAVLGANDGVLSTASLILGVATASHSHNSILISGVSGLVAGALSMGAGEYVSVSSQSDAENAVLKQERRELAEDQAGELQELTQIYISRGLEEKLAAEVAAQLSKRDALAAHARDELDISKVMRARPLQAALASAASFSVGALIPLLVAIIAPIDWSIYSVYVISLCFLVLLGALGAWAGGAPMARGALRVTFWGALAMAVTAGIGALFHVSVT
jgi:VIT1/CCC1 family predicted Fe2+/Mn2+ transporter